MNDNKDFNKVAEELNQNALILQSLFWNVQNLTAVELLEFLKELTTFTNKIKHIYVNAALQGRITQTEPKSQD